MADRIEQLTEKAHKLTQLLDDPHPGLFTWNIAITDVLSAIADNLDAKTLHSIAEKQETA